MAPVRFFNTEGPVRAEKHYSVPPLARLDLEYLLTLSRREKYFVLHAPRQTGKTTALLALREVLDDGAAGDLYCVYANLEEAQAAREDFGLAAQIILSQIASQDHLFGDGTFRAIWKDALAEVGPGRAIGEALTRWSAAAPKPLVLLLDEVDALVGDTLLSVLRQLREGYDGRPKPFPHSVVLCGRYVSDYRRHREQGVVFEDGLLDLPSVSLRLGNFTEAETHALLAQHTEETGQAFRPGAVDTVWEQTRGQPSLVNAVAYEACFENRAGRDRGRTITADDILEAREEIVGRREIRFDGLGDALREERVRRVVEPLLTGGDRGASEQDLEYVRDLGLITREDPTRIANPIYREAVPRELTLIAQWELDLRTPWYVDEDGGLEVPKLLSRFQEFFREHSEHWMGRFDYREAGAQLLLQAYCHRVVNGGGRVDREYGLGRRRTDLLLSWPQGDEWSRFVIECKVLDGSREATERQGLEQTAAYMDRCDAEAGHLVIFDRSEERSWEEKIYRKPAEGAGRPITIWGV